jgi:hypothetical protein
VGKGLGCAQRRACPLASDHRHALRVTLGTVLVVPTTKLVPRPPAPCGALAWTRTFTTLRALHDHAAGPRCCSRVSVPRFPMSPRPSEPFFFFPSDRPSQPPLSIRGERGMLLERLGQSFARHVQSRPNGAKWNAQHFGDFRVAQPFDREQRQHGAVLD